MRTKSYLLSILLLIPIALFVVGCSDNTEVTTVTVDMGDELDPTVWGEEYPLQYNSYLKNNEMAATDFGGSKKESKFISEPEIKELFKGYGFSIDYNEDRGHTYAIEDILASKRVNETTPGSCMTCKSPSVPKLIKTMGASYYTTPLLELAKQVKHPIACLDCHDSKTNELRVTRPAFVAAMKEKGIDVTKASKQEMRSYVCGQCHVEYYFKKDTKVVTYPWTEGFEPSDIEIYYDKIQFSDWEHPDSKAGMRKVQHPEFETWSTSVHGTAGVSCADCHMPYMREDNKKYSSHWWTSPLKTMDVSCQTCHNQDQKWLKGRVLNTQTKTFNQQVKASKVIEEAHQAIKKALGESAADKAKIKEAQALVVKAQWYWDWIAAENSRGFHNPVQALNSLATAIENAYKAKEVANSSY